MILLKILTSTRSSLRRKTFTIVCNLSTIQDEFENATRPRKLKERHDRYYVLEVTKLIMPRSFCTYITLTCVTQQVMHA